MGGGRLSLDRINYHAIPMVRHGRTDGNQSKIIRLSRQIPGVSVKVVSDLGEGFTDTIYGYKGANYLIEIKNGSGLTPAQKNFHGRDGSRPDLEWKGQKAIANCIEDVLRILGIRNF